MRLVADTGAIVSAINTEERDHARFRAVLESASAAFITPLVITEVHHVLTSRGLSETADAFVADVASGFYELISPSVDDFVAASRLVQQYRGSMQRKRPKPGSLDLADAMNVVVAAARETNLIAATDLDYRVVKPLSPHPAFVLLPADDPGGP